MSLVSGINFDGTASIGSPPYPNNFVQGQWTQWGQVAICRMGRMKATGELDYYYDAHRNAATGIPYIVSSRGDLFDSVGPKDNCKNCGARWNAFSCDYCGTPT